MRHSCAARSFPLVLGVVAIVQLVPVDADGQRTTRVWRVGAIDGPPHVSFGSIGGLTFLPGDRVLALDFQARRLHIYDEDGTHVRTFGGPGAGPGEFQFPAAPVVTEHGIGIYDGQLARMTWFDHEGELQRTEPFAWAGARFSGVAPLRGGRWIADDGGFSSAEIKGMLAGQLQRDSVGLREVVVLDSTGVDTIAAVRLGNLYWFDGDRGLPLGPLRGRGLADEGFWTTSGDSLVAIVDAVRGDIRWLRVEEEGLREVARRTLDLPPRRADLRFLEEAAREIRRERPTIARVDFITPRHAPHFRGAVLDALGRLWLSPATGGAEAAAVERVTVVPMGGADPFEVEVPAGLRLLAVRGDRVLGVTRDELDVQSIELLEIVPR